MEKLPKPYQPTTDQTYFESATVEQLYSKPLSKDSDLFQTHAPKDAQLIEAFPALPEAVQKIYEKMGQF